MGSRTVGDGRRSPRARPRPTRALREQPNYLEAAAFSLAFSAFFFFLSFTLSLGLFIVLGLSCPLGIVVPSLAQTRCAYGHQRGSSWVNI